MKKNVVCFVMFAATLAACGHKRVESVEACPEEFVFSDSLEDIPDTLALVSEPEVEEVLPETADELFDDFVFEFARLKKVQRERVKFPLPVILPGSDTLWIAEGQWTHEYLFLRQDYYTVFFNDEEQMELEKRTDLDHVEVEWIMASEQQIKTYSFEREKGSWYLVEENVRPFMDSSLADFVEFYERFVSDTVFQTARVADPLLFITTDPDDDFNVIEGTLDKEQWEAFKPQLPSGTLTNIRYGQTYEHPGEIIMVKRGIANGLMDVLTFRKSEDGWKLVAYEN